MRIAILSDIHGNLEALEATLEDVEKRGYDRLVCLGDVVGYGADPQECVDRIREVVWKEDSVEVVVKGNHDDAAAGGEDEYFNDQAQKAIRWTSDELSADAKKWLAGLPYEFHFPPDYYLVHSSPHDPECWNYVVNMGDALVAFQDFEERIGFIGHSHVPFCVSMNGEDASMEVITESRFELADGFRYLSNVGSVGQPRDGDWRSCYVILDLEEKTVERMRVEYPVERAAEKIREAGLPEFLASRLLRGR